MGRYVLPGNVEKVILKPKQDAAKPNRYENTAGHTSNQSLFE